MDMSRLGKLSGEARRRPNPERVHEGLRAYLRREVSPAEVWAALKLAMEGQNESARVAASRVLMDALHEPEDNRHANQVDVVAARAKLEHLIERYVAEAMGVGSSTNPRVQYDVKDGSPIQKTIAHAVAKAREGQDAELVALIEEILTKVRAGLKLVDPPAAEKTMRILEGLEEAGLVAGRDKIEQEIARRVAEQTEGLERERTELAAQRAEFTAA
jgi:hypothetical protein